MSTSPRVPDELLSLARENSAVAETLVEAFASEEMNAPAVGDIWRLEWDGAVAVGVLTRIGEDVIDVAPVGDDVEFADPATVLLDEAASPLGYPVGVWCAVETSLPRIVLDRFLGRLNDSELGLVLQLRRALHLQGDLPDDPRLGPALPADAADYHPRLTYRSHLQREIFEVGEAALVLSQAAATQHVEVAQPQPVEEEGSYSPPAVAGLGDLAADVGMTLKELGSLIGLRAREVVELKRGTLLLSRDQLQRIAAALQLPQPAVNAAAPKPDAQLQVLLHTPRWRSASRRRAQRQGLAETHVRREAAAALSGAGRRQRDEDATPWEEMLARYFGPDA